jgi:hypothetical protein
MAALTGIMESTGSCYYNVTSPDYNSAAHYFGELSAGCKLGNGVGVMVLLTMTLTLVALYDHRTADSNSEWKYSPVRDSAI